MRLDPALPRVAAALVPLQGRTRDGVDEPRDIRHTGTGLRHWGPAPGWPIFARLIWFIMRRAD